MPASQTTAVGGSDSQHLVWTMDRPTRAFSIKVVEPAEYRPADHGALFMKVVSELIAPTPAALAGREHEAQLYGSRHDRFDLTTFPEAFVDAHTLLVVLRAAAKLADMGCIHVGLRATDDPERHLFSLEQLRDFLGQLREVGNLVLEDLVSFEGWLGRQSGGMFNVGCLFAVDTKGLRICLHPKMVRSQFEAHVLSEHHMVEANLVSLVTILPVDPALMSITLQPLLCSDALDLPTDRPGGGPMKRLNHHVAAFDRPPDHVDVVSVATCTPQPPGAISKGGSRYRQWHDQFEKCFVDLAQGADFSRHHQAAMVLSNFREISEKEGGGLSGAFLPVPPPPGLDQPQLTVSCYGKDRERGGANRWSVPSDEALERWRTRGYVVGLNPFALPDNAPVKVFSFTLQRLLRDTSRWRTDPVFSQAFIDAGYVDEDRIVFSALGKTHV